MLSNIVKRYMRDLFWSIKNSGEILDKLKARDFNATSLSTYDFSTLYTTLPHNLIKDKLIDLIERTFQREGSPYLACNDRNAFFTSEKQGAQWLSGRVLDSRPKGSGFEPHRRHCVVVLEQDTFILA